MIPVSSHTQNKYTTGKTTVKNISDNVMISVDERLTSYVSNESLNTTLKSYVSNEDLEAKLSSYASTASVDEKLSSYVSNEALEAKLSSYASTASVDEKLKSYVSNESLNTTLKSYVSDEALETKLSSYVSNETLINYSTTSEVDDKISVANDIVTATIDKKISDAGYITRQDAIDIASYYSTFAITNTHFTVGENIIDLAGYHSAYHDYASGTDNVTCELRDYETNKVLISDDILVDGSSIDDRWSVFFTTWYDSPFDLFDLLGIGEMGLNLICKDRLTGKETSKWLAFSNYSSHNVDVIWGNNNVINGKDLYGLLSYETVVNTDGLPFVCRNYAGSDNTHVCCGVPWYMAAFTPDTSNYTSNTGTDLSQYVNDTAKEFMTSYTCGIMIPKYTRKITIDNTAPDTSYCDAVVKVYTNDTVKRSSTTYAGNTNTIDVSNIYSYTNIVDPSYAPAGTVFIKSTDIDWDKQYISTNIDVTNVIGTNANILSVGNSIGTWEGTHFHFYYTRSTKVLQIRYLNSDGIMLQQDVTLSNADTITFEISKENGLVINGTKYNDGNTPAEIYSDLFALTNIQVGVSEGYVHSTATYNYLRIAQDASFGVHGDTFLTISAKKRDGTAMTELPDLSYIKISFSE